MASEAEPAAATNESNDETFWQFLKSRLSHRFLSWYICSWLIWNWEIFAILSGSEYPIGYRIAWVKEVAYGADTDRRWQLLTVLCTFGMPLLAAIALKPIADFFIIVRRTPENWVATFDKWVVSQTNTLNWFQKIAWTMRVEASEPYNVLLKQHEETSREYLKLRAIAEGRKNRIAEQDRELKALYLENHDLEAFKQFTLEHVKAMGKLLFVVKLTGAIHDTIPFEEIRKELEGIQTSLDAIRTHPKLDGVELVQDPVPHPGSSPAPLPSPDQK
jgi:hypothetical protein